MVTTNIFESLAHRAELAEIDASDELEARQWYRTQASKIQRINNKEIIDPRNIRTFLTPKNVGQLFMFFYDPKNKNTLPYYDRFPLVFPVELYRDGFLGINLHYLPHQARAKLMDALYLSLNNQKYNESTRLRITYSILRNSVRLRYFKPCLKKYLYGQVLQKFLYIDPENWDKALMLPTERFAKKSTSFVHMESMRSLTGNL